MRSAIVFGAALAVFVETAVSQTVTCNAYGLTACPYAAATTADLEALIAKFCGDDGGYPYYKYYEDIEATLPVGYYQVTSDRPNGFSQAVCDSSLNLIVNDCTADGFWIEGEVVIPVPGDEITFSVTNCELA